MIFHTLKTKDVRGIIPRVKCKELGVCADVIVLDRRKRFQKREARTTKLRGHLKIRVV